MNSSFNSHFHKPFWLSITQPIRTFDLSYALFFLEVTGAPADDHDLGDVALFQMNACVCSVLFTCDTEPPLLQENTFVSVWRISWVCHLERWSKLCGAENTCLSRCNRCGCRYLFSSSLSFFDLSQEESFSYFFYSLIIWDTKILLLSKLCS